MSWDLGIPIVLLLVIGGSWLLEDIRDRWHRR